MHCDCGYTFRAPIRSWPARCRCGRIHDRPNWPQAVPLGNRLEDGLRWIGLTKRRWWRFVNWIRRLMGIEPAAKCECEIRRRKLNSWWSRIRGAVVRAFQIRPFGRRPSRP